MVSQDVINIKGVSCGHCKMAVEKAVASIDGVSVVSVDLEGGKADVTYDSSKTSMEDIKKAIADAGYTPE